MANDPAAGLRPVSLDDKFDLSCARIFVSGPQALVRALLTQHALDRSEGLSTAGYVSGYRGSPLGGLDLPNLEFHEQVYPVRYRRWEFRTDAGGAGSADEDGDP